jgi:hypothetical protein
VEREIVIENFGKRKMWKRIVGENFGERAKKKWEEKFGRDSERNEDVGKTFRKIAI